MVKINQIDNISIMASNFKVKWDPETDGGSFDWTKSEIVIGIKSLETDPLYTLHIINHEVTEIIAVAMGLRYSNGRTDDYLFSMTHNEYETLIKLSSQALCSFIKFKK